jgi:hypothetical protein
MALAVVNLQETYNCLYMECNPSEKWGRLAISCTLYFIIILRPIHLNHFLLSERDARYAKHYSRHIERSEKRHFFGLLEAIPEKERPMIASRDDDATGLQNSRLVRTSRPSNSWRWKGEVIAIL